MLWARWFPFILDSFEKNLWLLFHLNVSHILVTDVNVIISGLHNCHRLEHRDTNHISRLAGNSLSELKPALVIKAIDLLIFPTASSYFKLGVCFRLFHWDQLNLTHWLQSLEALNIEILLNIWVWHASLSHPKDMLFNLLAISLWWATGVNRLIVELIGTKIASVASLYIAKNLIDRIILHRLFAIRCAARETKQMIDGALLAALQSGLMERISVLKIPHLQVIL